MDASPETAREEAVLDGRRLAAVIGDITRIPADAIVNAANESLVGGGGVDGAIHRAAGPAVMAELRDRYGAGRHCPTGSAVTTGAGSLPATWVIHAVGPVWTGGGAGEPELLAAAYRSAFRLADAEGARSITFPAISCGVYGYPIEAAATVAVDTLANELSTARSTEAATFVLFSPRSFEAFAAAIRQLSL